MNIYHFITISDYNNDYYKYRNLGICSPKALYDLNKELFMKTTFENYKQRTATFLKKQSEKITPEDILNFLDNSPIRKNKDFNSKTIFFSFLPSDKLNKQLLDFIKPAVQLTINTKSIEKFKPKLVIYGTSKNITWNNIKDPKFIEWIEKISNVKPTNKNRIYARMPHLAVLNAYQITPDNILNKNLIK